MAKTEILKFRVTPEEKEILEEKAYGSYRTMSRYLRDCALDKEIIVVPGADDIAEELRRIGNNLNQITKLANMGKVDAIDLTETSEALTETYQAVYLLARTNGGANWQS